MMWELIALNRRKSFVLFAGMAALLVLLGYFIGSVFDPEYGGVVGVAIAIAVWLVLTLVTIHSGEDILLRASRAREVTRDVHPRLFNIVEEMKIAAGLPAMPKVYIIDEPAPNAFAIGMSPEKSAIAVTAGMLSRLNRDELQGVVAHEMSHIVNRDSRLMTIAGILLGSIVLLSQAFLRSWWFLPSGSRRYRRSRPGDGDPRLQLIMIAVAVVLAVLAPIFAQLLYFGISRKREYLADATAVQLTRYPEGLASALEKISSTDIVLEGANAVTAPMYIVRPQLLKQSRLAGLGSTHPPVEKRIKVLRMMTRGADYTSYQQAFSKMRGKDSALIPAGSLREAKRIAIRNVRIDAAEAKTDAKAQAREAMDIMRAMNDYAFIVCVCGLKMKLPPEIPKSKKVPCPKCGRKNEIPVAEMAMAGVLAGAVGVGSEGAVDGDAVGRAEPSDRGLVYERRTSQWETFSCVCGRFLQLSPAFQGSQVKCRDCERITTIK